MPNTQTRPADELFQEGQALRLKGEYEQAITLLAMAIRENPQLAAAHLELGLAYCFSGLFDESIRELESAITLNPTDPESHLHLAKTYTMLGMYPEGITSFRTILELSHPGEKPYEEAMRQLSYFK